MSKLEHSDHVRQSTDIPLSLRYSQPKIPPFYPQSMVAQTDDPCVL